MATSPPDGAPTGVSIADLLSTSRECDHHNVALGCVSGPMAPFVFLGIAGKNWDSVMCPQFVHLPGTSSEPPVCSFEWHSFCDRTYSDRPVLTDPRVTLRGVSQSPRERRERQQLLTLSYVHLVMLWLKCGCVRVPITSGT